MALKILLADDSMTAQNMGKKILVDAGYDVVAVSNGAAAIKKIASEQPDIIILDVYMPGYTGLEVCERVKGSLDTSQTPVLLTVGKMEPFKSEEASRVHADGVMIKPFEATDLVAAIQNIGNKMAQAQRVPYARTIKISPPPATNLGDTQRIWPPPAMGSDNLAHLTPPAPAEQHRDTQKIDSPTETIDPSTTVQLSADQLRAIRDLNFKSMPSDTGSAPAVAGPSPALSTSLSGLHEAPDAESTVTSAPVALVDEEEAVPQEPFVASSVRHIEIPDSPDLKGTVIEQARASRLSGSPIFVPQPPAEPPVIVPAPAEEAKQEPVAAQEEWSAPQEEPVATHEEQAVIPSPTGEESRPYESVEVAEHSHVLAPEAAETSEMYAMREAPVEAEMPTHLGADEPKSEAWLPPSVETAPVPQHEEAFAEHAHIEAETAPPELETSEPLMGAVVTDVAPGLEVTSPVFAQEQVDVQAANDLVTDENEDELAGFSTKFGVEGAESIAVGVASELPPEQWAAITGAPIQEPEAEPAFEDAAPLEELPLPEELAAEPQFTEEAPAVEQQPEPVSEAVQEEAAQATQPAEAVEEPVAETPATDEPVQPGVMAEVGTIESAPAMDTQPMVAYVPGYGDSQVIGAMPPAPDTGTHPAYAAAESEPVVVSGIGPIQPDALIGEHATALRMIEAAAKAAFAGDALSAIGHLVAQRESAGTAASVLEPPVPEAPVEEIAATPEIAEPVPAESVAEELVGSPSAETGVAEPTEVAPPEAATAETIESVPADQPVVEAAALAVSEPQPEEVLSGIAETAAEAVASELPAVAPTAISAADVTPDGQPLMDARLAEAIARALEKLKPQLITEIVKELSHE